MQTFLQGSDVVPFSEMDFTSISSNVYFHCFFELLEEHTIDESLVSGTCVLKTERHYFVAIRTAVCDECGFFSRSSGYHDLIVSWKYFLERQEFVPRCCFDLSIDVWKWEAIFRTEFIEISEIDAYSPLPFFLPQRDWQANLGIWFSLSIIFWGVSQLRHWLRWRFWSQLSSFLLDRLESRVHVELMTCYVNVDPRHIFHSPSKHTKVFFSDKLWVLFLKIHGDWLQFRCNVQGEPRQDRPRSQVSKLVRAFPLKLRLSVIAKRFLLNLELGRSWRRLVSSSL